MNIAPISSNIFQKPCNPKMNSQQNNFKNHPSTIKNLTDNINFGNKYQLVQNLGGSRKNIIFVDIPKALFEKAASMLQTTKSTSSELVEHEFALVTPEVISGAFRPATKTEASNMINNAVEYINRNFFGIGKPNTNEIHNKLSEIFTTNRDVSQLRRIIIESDTEGRFKGLKAFTDVYTDKAAAYFDKSGHFDAKASVMHPAN